MSYVYNLRQRKMGSRALIIANNYSGFCSFFQQRIVNNVAGFVDIPPNPVDKFVYNLCISAVKK